MRFFMMERARSILAHKGVAERNWYYVRYAIAFVLLVAAGAKIVNRVEILAGDGLLSTRPMLLVAIGFESAVASFLMFGDLFSSWVVTGATFVVLSGISAYAIATGQDCNCISHAIDPKVMLQFDLAVLALVAWMRPVRRASWSKRVILEITGSVGLGILVAGSTSLYDSPRKGDPLQFLIADTLVAQRWPLNATLNPELAALDRGNWMVLIVRRDCEHCRELIAKHFVDPHRHRPNERTAVFVAGESTWPFQFDEVAIDFKVKNTIAWPVAEPFVASPGVFLIKNGIVAQGEDGMEADAFLKDAISNSVTSY